MEREKTVSGHPDLEGLPLRERLLVLLVINPEIDITMIREVLSSKSYYNKTLTSLKKEGLIKGVKSDKLATYRLTNTGKKRMQEKYPELVEHYLISGDGKYKTISHKPDRRIMYTEDAWIYQSMIEAGIDSLGEYLFNEADEISDRYVGNPPRMTYFGKTEFKAHLNQEQRGSRNKGIVFDKTGKPYLVYGTYAGHITFYHYKEFALSRVATGKFENSGIVPQGTRKIPMLVFGHNYDHAETIIENTRQDAENRNKGQMMETSKMRITDDFERIVCIPRGKTGRTSMRLLMDLDAYAGLKGQLLAKMEPSGNRVIDAFTKTGQSVYVMFVMDMNKLQFIMSEDNEAFIVCFKGMQEEFLCRVMENRRRKVNLYPVEEDTIRKALGWE